MRARSFFHCAKAYMRSRLWEPRSWPDELYQVGFGIYFADDEVSAAEIDAGTAGSYAKVQAAVDGEAAEVDSRRRIRRSE